MDSRQNSGASALCLTTSLTGADELSVNVPAPASEPFTVPSPIPIQISYPEAYYPPYIVVPPPTPYDTPFVVTRPIYGYSYWRAPWWS
jgi:hypothetical protein